VNLHSQSISAPYRRLAIVVLAFTAYWPTLKVGFLWDDHVMIEGNASIRQWSLPNIKQDFSSDPFSGQGDPYYRPLQTIFNRLDYTVWGLHPFGYHLTNLMFHAANSVLLGELVIALGFGPLTALVAGCLFSVHPIGVEQLMIIAGRAELMTLCFTLINLLLFLEGGILALVAGTVAYALALLSKENAIITPALFLLLAWYQKEKRPLWGRLAAYLAVTIPYLFLRSRAVGVSIPAFPPFLAARFLFQAFPKVAFLYAKLILIPWNLHSHRMIPHLSHVWFFYLAGWICLALWLKRKNIRWGLLSLGWFILTFLPKIPSMMIGNFILDHWAYPAAIGMMIPLGVGIVWCWEHPDRNWRKAVALGFLPLLILWALLTQLNVALRGTDEKMYRWALNFTISRPIKYNLGILLLQSGRAREALQYLQEVHDVYPENAADTHAMALAYWQIGHRQAAITILQRLLKVNPTYQPAIDSLRAMKSAPIDKSTKIPNLAG
jgi:tetratricopeptide (TPR) repeat protein